MRCLGEIRGREAAEQFVAHLMILEVDTQIEASPTSPEEWEIWVKDENQLDLATREFNHYQEFSSDPKFAAALEKANRILRDREQERESRVEAKIQQAAPKTPALLKGRPKLPVLTTTLFALCVLVAFATNFATPSQTNDFGQTVMKQLSFRSPELAAQETGPGASLLEGQVWRVITPIFLHVNPLHLVVNLFLLISLGRLIEHWIGTPRFALMVLALAVIPNLCQGLLPPAMQGTPDFGGISGVLYGLFGYVWIRTSLNPSHGLTVPLPIVLVLLGLIAFGISGVFGDSWNMADIAHLGGLLLGCAIGYWSEQEARGKQVA